MPRLSGFNRPSCEGEGRKAGVQVFRCLGVQVLRCSGVEGWMKVVWAENVIGRNRFGMKVSWMKLSSLLDGLGR